MRAPKSTVPSNSLESFIATGTPAVTQQRATIEPVEWVQINVRLPVEMVTAVRNYIDTQQTVINGRRVGPTFVSVVQKGVEMFLKTV